MMNLSHQEIVTFYNDKIRGLINFYKKRKLKRASLIKASLKEIQTRNPEPSIQSVWTRSNLKLTRKYFKRKVMQDYGGRKRG